MVRACNKLSNPTTLARGSITPERALYPKYLNIYFHPRGSFPHSNVLRESKLKTYRPRWLLIGGIRDLEQEYQLDWLDGGADELTLQEAKMTREEWMQAPTHHYDSQNRGNYGASYIFRFTIFGRSVRAKHGPWLEAIALLVSPAQEMGAGRWGGWFKISSRRYVPGNESPDKEQRALIKAQKMHSPSQATLLQTIQIPPGEKVIIEIEHTPAGGLGVSGRLLVVPITLRE